LGAKRARQRHQPALRLFKLLKAQGLLHLPVLAARDR
jgi:hypothetical protein